ncbi:DUF3653 domain-containing protein [Nitrosomonas ureae]|uniref:DUF3653 domain-containing protein n=1 Tax=Nitrosomonas ureae TaxID=44577 RepID=UPI0011B0E521
MTLGGVGCSWVRSLLSPEGKNFTARDLDYLSLTFAMARQWRIDREEKRKSGLLQKRTNLLLFVRPKNGGKNGEGKFIG